MDSVAEEMVRSPHYPASEEEASLASHRRKCKKPIVKNKQRKPRLKKRPRLVLHRSRPLDMEALVAKVEKLFLEKREREREREKEKENAKYTYNYRPTPKLSPAEVKERWPLPEEYYQKRTQAQITNMVGWGPDCTNFAKPTPGSWGPLPADEFRKRWIETGYDPIYNPPPYHC